YPGRFHRRRRTLLSAGKVQGAPERQEPHRQENLHSRLRLDLRHPGPRLCALRRDRGEVGRSARGEIVMESPDYDVIVMGGGPAGATAATLVAAGGYKVA